MKPGLYAFTRRSPTAHSEQLTENRRLAALASIRAARNLRRIWNVAAVIFGLGIAALLSGFGLWAPILSTASIAGSLVLAVAAGWTGAVLLPRPTPGVLWFTLPMAAGLVFTAIPGNWAAFGVLAGCIAIPFISLALYQTDARRQT
jgi:hypothetical protein